MTDESATDIAELSFEAALEELEAIVRKLEAGEAPLDESIELYARGDKLRAQCEARLKAAKARIDKLQLDADGKPAGVEPLDPA
ncbi:exodeoxyribonuclease VII small subunit [Parasphingopyxis algicola]|uniref:exodeoxyribonuclease VII small subunit n=1 Tax=Parasphingopyxis algicola TaxID=2026624 RepID=UPI0015A15FB8|nr:exodeoxyribonuclease VII small subunit [Parasphingopyxis algicola]QLC23702.1 exodeoxyribonuclease VII small subunit [Parasphingopyxis algicola]